MNQLADLIMSVLPKSGDLTSSIFVSSGLFVYKAMQTIEPYPDFVSLILKLFSLSIIRYLLYFPGHSRFLSIFAALHLEIVSSGGRNVCL